MYTSFQQPGGKRYHYDEGKIKTPGFLQKKRRVGNKLTGADQGGLIITITFDNEKTKYFLKEGGVA